MEQNPQHKWVFKVSTRLTQATADQLWPLFEDFFNLHKWFPGLPTCYGVHGTNGEPGCIRHCAGFSLPSNGGVSWSRERLISIDPVHRVITYDIVDCNIGFKSYVSTVQIKANDSDGQTMGCLIEWSITVDPVEGARLEDLVKKYENGLEGMAKKMEDAVGSTEHGEE